MAKDDAITLPCRQCGRQFIFTKAEQEFYEMKGFAPPGRCAECRSTRQTLHSLVCSECGTEMEKGTSVFCAPCLAAARLEAEVKARESQKAASAAHTQMLASDSQRTELEESLRQRKKQIDGLERQINELSQNLDEARQFQAILGLLQPSLNGIEGKLESLEHAHNKINERMLLLVQKVHEMYENVSLWELVKRSLKHYQGQDAYQK